MFIRLTAALFALSTATVVAAAEKKEPELQSTVIADYPANDQGVTYQVVLEGVPGQFEGHLIVRVLKGEKELSRVPTFVVPNGDVQKIASADDRWTIRPRGASADEGPTLLTIRSFALNKHEQGLLFSRAVFQLYQSSQLLAIGWNHGAVKELWSERRAGNDHILQPETRQVGNESEMVLVEWSLKTGFVGQYAFFRRDPKSGRFTQERTAYGVALQAVKNDSELLSVVNACHKFTGQMEVRFLSGPSFPALKEPGGVAVALTDDEAQAKKWAKELAACREGAAPAVVRLK